MSLDVPGNLHKATLFRIVLNQKDESFLMIVAVIVFILQLVVHEVAAVGVLFFEHNSSSLRQK